MTGVLRIREDAASEDLSPGIVYTTRFPDVWRADRKIR